MVNLGSLWQSLPKLHRTLLGRRSQSKSSYSPRDEQRRYADNARCGCNSCDRDDLVEADYAPFKLTILQAGHADALLTNVGSNNDSKRQQPGADHLKNGLMSISCCSTASARSNIRTNPWIAAVGPQAIAEAESPLRPRADMKQSQSKVSSIGSERSSGYGSHDSSPSCSVHSPDWTAGDHRKQQEEVGLQCSMTEDKAVSCTEADFLLAQPDDDDWPLEEDEDRLHWRIFGRPWQVDKNASSFGIIEELNEKLIRVKIKSDALKAAVSRLRCRHHATAAAAATGPVKECRYPLYPVKFTTTTFEVAL